MQYGPPAFFGCTDLFLVTIVIFDFVSRGKIHPATLWGSLFLIVSRLDWGATLILAIAAVSLAASARQAPLHALTTELVGPELRGEYIALRNAASQLGIALVAALSALYPVRRRFPEKI